MPAFVALRDGHAADRDAPIASARASPAGDEVPKNVRYIDEEPRNAAGKLLRRAVRDRFWDGREREV